MIEPKMCNIGYIVNIEYIELKYLSRSQLLILPVCQPSIIPISNLNSAKNSENIIWWNGNHFLCNFSDAKWNCIIKEF